MDLYNRATTRVPGPSYANDATVHATIPCKPCVISEPPYVSQPTSESCWAATATMLASAHDSISYTIEAILEKAAVKQIGDIPPPDAPTLDNLHTYMKTGIPNTGEFPKFLGQLGITVAPGATLTPAAICALISNHGPIGANISTGPTSTHEIVIYGIDYDEETGCQIIYHDPGSAGAASEMSLDQFDSLYGQGASQDVHFYYYP